MNFIVHLKQIMQIMFFLQLLKEENFFSLILVGEICLFSSEKKPSSRYLKVDFSRMVKKHCVK